MFTDKRRIRRALLRFQLYCELFHQPGDSSESVSDWEERLEEQEAFWLRYEWWEVEEVKCIYQVLVFCFENTTAGDLSQFYEASDGEHPQQRGLIQLRHFLDESVAPPQQNLGEGICVVFSPDHSMDFIEQIQTTSAIFHILVPHIYDIMLMRE